MSKNEWPQLSYCMIWHIYYEGFFSFDKINESEIAFSHSDIVLKQNKWSDYNEWIDGDLFDLFNEYDSSYVS